MTYSRWRYFYNVFVNRLKNIFHGNCLCKALEIIDNNLLIEIVCVKSHRSFFKVQGSQQKVYHILYPAIFCPCIAFAQHLVKSDSFLVKLLHSANI